MAVDQSFAVGTHAMVMMAFSAPALVSGSEIAAELSFSPAVVRRTMAKLVGARKDRTFGITPTGIDRLAEDKQMVVILTRGLSYSPGRAFAECDHLTGWMRDILGFIGVDGIEFITADNLDFATPEEADASIEATKASIDLLAASW